MDSYEYDGYSVLAVGMDADGYFVETVFGEWDWEELAALS